MLRYYDEQGKRRSIHRERTTKSAAREALRELTDLSVPLGVWDLESEKGTPYLWAERLAAPPRANADGARSRRACMRDKALDDRQLLAKFLLSALNPTNGSWWIVQVQLEAGLEVSAHCRGRDYKPEEGSSLVESIERIHQLPLVGFLTYLTPPWPAALI